MITGTGGELRNVFAGEPQTAMLIAPAVTSWSPADQRPTNPAVRQVYYDRWGNHLVEVEQYYLNYLSRDEPVRIKFIS